MVRFPISDGIEPLNWFSPKNRYFNIDYSYTSANSKYSKNHWIKFARNLEKKFTLKNKKIIEIGANDGFLISILKNMGADVLAVDASKLMVQICIKTNIFHLNNIANY